MKQCDGIDKPERCLELRKSGGCPKRISSPTQCLKDWKHPEKYIDGIWLIDTDKKVKSSGYEQPHISNNIFNAEFKETVLTALYYLWKEAGEEENFWVSAKQVNHWIKKNEQKDFDVIKIGRFISRSGFKVIRKLPTGKYRFIQYKKLMKIIEAYNKEDAEFKKLTEQHQNYEDIKCKLFQKLLSGKDIMKEPYAPEILQKIGQEFIALGEDEADKWVKENGWSDV